MSQIIADKSIFKRSKRASEIEPKDSNEKKSRGPLIDITNSKQAEKSAVSKGEITKPSPTEGQIEGDENSLGMPSLSSSSIEPSTTATATTTASTTSTTSALRTGGLFSLASLASAEEDKTQSDLLLGFTRQMEIEPSTASSLSSLPLPLPLPLITPGLLSPGSIGSGSESESGSGGQATSEGLRLRDEKMTEDDSEGHPSEQGILSWSDPLNQYTETVYQELRKNELKYRPKADYMETVQKDINHTMRGILVDWLVEVGEEYKLSSQTLFLTVKYIDRLLSAVSVHRTKLQLVGITCMLLASKYEEIYPPSVDDFVYISDNTYSRDEVLRMETVLLNSLKFSLTNATSWEFARRFSAACGLDKRCSALANYIIEAFLQENQYLRYLPSHIGASAVCLTLHMTKQKPWPKKLESSSGFAPTEIKDCVAALHQTITRLYNGTCQLKAVKTKYSEPKLHRVALIAPPTDLPPI